jgi:uncharacterized SAM-binding protein YcdF (DUF218 family)
MPLSYLEPVLPLLLLLGIIGLGRAWWRSAKGTRPWLLTISMGGILLLSLNAVAWIASLPLESWYERTPVSTETAQAIVILSGTVKSPNPNRPYPLPSQDTYERLQHGVWLFKHWRPLPILVCGGTFDGHQPFSVTMRRILVESEGIPSDMVWVESRSRSTHENALYGSEVLREHGVTRVALVVEANSMLRASKSFQKEGITVIPEPIRFARLNREVTDFFPSWSAIALNGETVHELGGLLWYRLRGWI